MWSKDVLRDVLNRVNYLKKLFIYLTVVYFHPSTFPIFISFLVQYYTSPISDYTFTSQSEVLEYLFSGMDEQILQSKESAAEMTLQVHLTTIQFFYNL
jgi:hypothetical protein